MGEVPVAAFRRAHGVFQCTIHGSRITQAPTPGKGVTPVSLKGNPRA
jgi:hypothetical protein